MTRKNLCRIFQGDFKIQKIPKIPKYLKKSQKSQKSLEKSLENLTKFKFLSFFFRVICPLS